MGISDRLKETRRSKHLTQKQLAKKVNVSAQVISNWERGYTSPDHDDVLQLAKVLDVSADYLLGRNEIITEHHVARFRKRLSDQRDRKGLTYGDLANAANVTPAYIEELETTTQKLPGVGTLYELAYRLDVTPDYLAGFTADPQGTHPDTPKPKELREFLHEKEVMFDGVPLSDDDKEKVDAVLQALFLDAKKRNKRKK